MADKLWWLGTVLERKPFDCDYPDSTFQSYSIKWEGDDQEPDQLSPWDMEIIPHDFGKVCHLFSLRSGKWLKLSEVKKLTYALEV